MIAGCGCGRGRVRLARLCYSDWCNCSMD